AISSRAPPGAISAASAPSGSPACSGDTATPPAAGRAALWKRREHASPQNRRVRPRPDQGTGLPQPGLLHTRGMASPATSGPGSADPPVTSVMEASFSFPAPLFPRQEMKRRANAGDDDRDMPGAGAGTVH